MADSGSRCFPCSPCLPSLRERGAHPRIFEAFGIHQRPEGSVGTGGRLHDQGNAAIPGLPRELDGDRRPVVEPAASDRQFARIPDQGPPAETPHTARFSSPKRLPEASVRSGGASCGEGCRLPLPAPSGDTRLTVRVAGLRLACFAPTSTALRFLPIRPSPGTVAGARRWRRCGVCFTLCFKLAWHGNQAIRPGSRRIGQGCTLSPPPREPCVHAPVAGTSPRLATSHARMGIRPTRISSTTGMP